MLQDIFVNLVNVFLRALLLIVNPGTFAVRVNASFLSLLAGMMKIVVMVNSVHLVTVFLSVQR